MSKKKQIQIDWTTAPEWANWFAVDEDGMGNFFKDKPIQDLNIWKVSGSGGIMYMGYYTKDNWRESLQQRPDGV